MARVPGPRHTFQHLSQILHRQRKIAVGVLGACLAIAFIYLLASTRLYRATARCSVEPSTAVQADGAGQAAPMGNFLRTQSERITSRAILALALSNPDLKELKTFAGTSNRLTAIRQALSVEIGRTDDTIAVSFETPYADDAPRVANAVVDAYKRYQTQPAASDGDDVVTLYQGQLDKLHKELDSTTARMQAIEQKYGVLSSSPTASDDINQRRLASISQDLTAAQSETAKAKADVDQAIAALPKAAQKPFAAYKLEGKPLIDSPDEEERLRVEMIDLEARREAMAQRYLPDHPALVALGRQIEADTFEYADAVQRRWLLAQKHEQELQNAFDAQQKQIVNLSATTAEYGRLVADADRLHKSIDNLDARVQAIEVTRDSAGVHVDFFDPAENAVKSHPRWLSTLFLTLLIGLVLGIGTALLREAMDDRAGSSQNIRSIGLPILGSVPEMPWVMSLSVAAQKVALDPASDVAQGYRAIRQAIDSSAPRDRRRTIVVTSPDAGDGKTTSAANLAIALAQSGKRVLLVDAVLRDPMLHVIFGVSPKNGLSTLLSGKAGALDKAIRKTSANGLWVLPAGAAPAHPTELLNTPELPELLEQLYDKYDHIIIDAPPIADLPDARIIAASCDLTLLVLRTTPPACGARHQPAMHLSGLAPIFWDSSSPAPRMKPSPLPAPRPRATAPAASPWHIFPRMKT